MSIRSAAHKLFRRLLDSSRFFDRNSAKIVALPSDDNVNYVMLLKEHSLLEKPLKSEPKSAYKWQRNACSNYAPLECTVLRTRSVTKKKQTPHFRTYSRRALYDLPQTLYGDRTHRDHQKGINHLLIQRIFFLRSARKIRPN